MVRRGEIVEEGTHADLVRVPDGAYATLVRLQQQRAAAGEEDADSLVRSGSGSASGSGFARFNYYIVAQHRDPSRWALVTNQRSVLCMLHGIEATLHAGEAGA